jgi:hypothetical protein
MREPQVISVAAVQGAMADYISSKDEQRRDGGEDGPARRVIASSSSVARSVI